MKRQDARSLPWQAQEEKRKQAVRLFKQGNQYQAIADLVEVHEQTVGKWIRAYKSGGIKVLSSMKRGRRKGSGCKLTKSEQEHIQKLIHDKTPDQLKMVFALWTRKAVQELIEIEFGIQIAIRTTGDYLSSWGFTPQKPLKKAYEQNPKKVQQWLEEDYPLIKAQAKQEGAEIFWADETGLRNHCQNTRGYAPKGKTPVLMVSSKRSSTNMISAITNQGKVRFQVYDDNMNADILIGFLKRLIKASGRKVYLILDNLRVHHAQRVKQWLDKHKQKIQVFYLPAYSPELNPDEYLNCDLKAGVHSTSPARNNEQLKKKLISHMRMLQKRPDRVKKYFQHHKIAYAA